MSQMYWWLERVMPRGSLGNTVSRNSESVPPHRCARWSFVKSTSDLRNSERRSVRPLLSFISASVPTMVTPRLEQEFFLLFVLPFVTGRRRVYWALLYTPTVRSAHS